jgi:PTH1 family peptidyl-tRNA hydrolase
MVIKLVVGLQNPGAVYERTRHNAGGWFLHALARRNHFVFKEHKKYLGDVAECMFFDARCLALLPSTFMNHSGQAVRAICDFYRINPPEILVAHDELDLPVGSCKLKTGGGHGGHNGLRDIISHLGSTDFHRLRIGISHPGQKDRVLDYVLGKPNEEDKQHIISAIERAVEVFPLLVQGRLDLAMTQLHTKE